MDDRQTTTQQASSSINFGIVHLLLACYGVEEKKRKWHSMRPLDYSKTKLHAEVHDSHHARREARRDAVLSEIPGDFENITLALCHAKLKTIENKGVDAGSGRDRNNL